jgi:recombination protein RecA
MKKEKEGIVVTDQIDKNKQISELINSIQREYGPGSINLLSKDALNQPFAGFSTGLISLDKVLGGRCPYGRIMELFGGESVGKSSLALQIVAAVQKIGGTAAYIDIEHAFDPKYSVQLGVDIEKLLLSQPDNGEQAMNILVHLCSSGLISLVVIDSVAALVPRSEIEGEVGDQSMGVMARMMGQTLRKVTAIAHKTNTEMLFINQIRQKIGILYGSNETTPGGNSLKFSASHRLKLSLTGQIKDGDKIIGNTVKIKVVKNKLAAPFQETELDMLAGKGFDVEKDIIDMGVKYGLIEKSGSWYSYKTERLGQGIKQVSSFFKSNPLLAEELKVNIMKKLNGDAMPVVVEVPALPNPDGVSF